MTKSFWCLLLTQVNRKKTTANNLRNIHEINEYFSNEFRTDILQGLREVYEAERKKKLMSTF